VRAAGRSAVGNAHTASGRQGGTFSSFNRATISADAVLRTVLKFRDLGEEHRV